MGAREFIEESKGQTVKEAFRFAEISDKWGPAGYLQVKDTDIYVFFGYASC